MGRRTRLRSLQILSENVICRVTFSKPLVQTDLSSSPSRSLLGAVVTGVLNRRLGPTGKLDFYPLFKNRGKTRMLDAMIRRPRAKSEFGEVRAAGVRRRYPVQTNAAL